MADGRPASRVVRWTLAGAAALAALWLAWLTVAVAVARESAEKAPDEALRWRPGYAAALARKAELALPDAAFAKNTGAVEADARRALAHGPLEVTALRVLGEAASARGDDAEAVRLMRIATDRSLRDGPAQAWMFRYELRQRRYAAAFAHGQTLLRVPGAGRVIGRQMAAAAASDPEAQTALAKMLAGLNERPQSVMQELAAAMDPGAFFYFLIDLKDAGAALRRDEAELAIKRLLRERDISEAYLAWVQLLPPSGQKGLGNVYDGDFEDLPGAPPFNWRLGERAEISKAPDGEGKSLYVHYEGERPAELTEQTVLLPPGPYQLRVRGRMADAGYGEQIVWSAACAGSGQRLFELTAPDDAGGWRELSADFTVPPGCGAQVLRLDGRPGDRLGFVRAWFDGMIIAPGGES